MGGEINYSKLKVPPEEHELETARYFAERGYDIEFIPPNNIPDMHTPDIMMDGVAWEMKCPKGKSRNTIQKIIRQAVKQSHYIIIDLRRINVPEDKCISQIERQVTMRPYIKRLLIITKNEELLDFGRKAPLTIREEILLYTYKQGSIHHCT